MSNTQEYARVPVAAWFGVFGAACGLAVIDERRCTLQLISFEPPAPAAEAFFKKNKPIGCENVWIMDVLASLGPWKSIEMPVSSTRGPPSPFGVYQLTIGELERFFEFFAKLASQLKCW
jgi:hypothetical protein